MYTSVIQAPLCLPIPPPQHCMVSSYFAALPKPCLNVMLCDTLTAEADSLTHYSYVHRYRRCIPLWSFPPSDKVLRLLQSDMPRSAVTPIRDWGCRNACPVALHSITITRGVSCLSLLKFIYLIRPARGLALLIFKCFPSCLAFLKDFEIIIQNLPLFFLREQFKL